MHCAKGESSSDQSVDALSSQVSSYKVVPVMAFRPGTTFRMTHDMNIYALLIELNDYLVVGK